MFGAVGSTEMCTFRYVIVVHNATNVNTNQRPNIQQQQQQSRHGDEINKIKKKKFINEKH